MSRRIVSMTTLTPTATADTTTLVDATYPFLLQGGTGSQINRVWEISLAGQAANSSSPTFMLLSRDSTVGTTNTLSTGENDAALDGSQAALTNTPLTGNTNSGAKPQRSSSLHLANCSLNAFGGNYFWRANRAEECFTTYGNTASVGEVSVSAFTGGTPGAIGSHLIYETI